jgi:hypothetical protein
MLFLLILTALPIKALPGPRVLAQNEGPVTVRVSPANLQLVVGETREVVVEVVDVQALYGFDVSLAFDTQLIRVIDADPAQEGAQVAFGTLLDSGIVAQNKVDEDAGTIRFAMTQINPSESKSGTGALIVIKLRGKQAGTTTSLTLVEAQLARRDGTPVETTLVSAKVQVTESGTDQATATPIPTRNPSAFSTPSATTTGNAPTRNPGMPTEKPTGTSVPTATTAPATGTPASIAPTAPATTRSSTSGATDLPPTETPSAGTQEAAAATQATPVATTETQSTASVTPMVVAVEGTALPEAAKLTAVTPKTSSGASDERRKVGDKSWALWLAVGLLGSSAVLFALAFYLAQQRSVSGSEES